MLKTLVTIFLLCTTAIDSHVRTQGINDLSLGSDLEALLTAVVEKLTDLERRVEDLANHQLSQDVYTNEISRSNGVSGIKQVRNFRTGTKPYYLAHHRGSRMAGMHNHANFIRTIGLGELMAVLNGVHFRTRHNDYQLLMPSRSSRECHATEEIPLPSVPNRVRNQPTVDDQIVEMRQWFKAWRDQDPSNRDYRQYFKPVLCYLEGAWYYPDTINIDLVKSKRHAAASNDFMHLQKQMKYSLESGRKDDLENLVFIPRSAYRVVNGSAEYAQWNYRILCHPLNRDLKLNRFRPIDDVSTRMKYDERYAELSNSMRTRFQLNPEDEDEWPQEKSSTKELLDDLMGEIPGLDNYGANLQDDALDSVAYELHRDDRDEMVPLNAAYYHRFFAANRKGAFGLNSRLRGFNDANLFVALNTQPNVVPTEVEQCTKIGKRVICEWVSQRFSYAIPLEVIYLTPLSTWNPYDIEYKGDAQSPTGRTVRTGGRNGRATPQKAFNGTNHNTYYITPGELFTGGEIASDPSDTTGRGATGVLDRNGVMRLVRDSGHRILFPSMPDVGTMRQRYPIMPIYGEGSTIWKEVEALKDIVLDYNQNRHMYRSEMPAGPATPNEAATDTQNRGLVLELAPGRAGHSHLLHLSAEQVDYLAQGQTVNAECEESDGHIHEFVVRRRDAGRNIRYFAGRITPSEPHANLLVEVPNPEEDVGVA